MKKLVVISIAFAVMLGFAIWQMVFTVKLYNYLLEELYAVEELTGDAPQRVDTPEIIAHLDKVMDKWEKNKEVLFCLGNHTILRTVDEKLLIMDASFRNNDVPASPAALRSAISLVKAVSNDDLPVLTNLF